MKRGARFVRLFLEALTVALGVEIALRRRPLERVFADTQRTSRRSPRVRQMPPARLERAIRAVYRILPFESTCLKHSLIFCRIRRRCGLPAELRIGVQKKDGVFGAHAWVEDGSGHVLTDPLDGFSPVPLRDGSIRDD
jgi:hypothetical protein